jgi:hypothetical protein
LHKQSFCRIESGSGKKGKCQNYAGLYPAAMVEGKYQIEIISKRYGEIRIIYQNDIFNERFG